MMFGGIPLGFVPLEEVRWFLVLGARHRVLAHAFRALSPVPDHAGRAWALRSVCGRVERADAAPFSAARCTRCAEILKGPASQTGPGMAPSGRAGTGDR